MRLFAQKKNFYDVLDGLDRAIAAGDIPVLPKRGEKNSILIYLVKVFERAALQQV
ncbi:hypothetical protein [uncultured Aliivibrio sp.]|uniref:hypothetical protein n=1 Tax=uncultured Aliivibrio sp. TaxID=873085 RepID=UPI002605C742|nr:hypothetical protein [uncultured Aliivibrio sp.]